MFHGKNEIGGMHKSARRFLCNNLKIESERDKTAPDLFRW